MLLGKANRQIIALVFCLRQEETRKNAVCSQLLLTGIYTNDGVDGVMVMLQQQPAAMTSEWRQYVRNCVGLC